jgi:hypothetical protein
MLVRIFIAAAQIMLHPLILDYFIQLADQLLLYGLATRLKGMPWVGRTIRMRGKFFGMMCIWMTKLPPNRSA